MSYKEAAEAFKQFEKQADDMKREMAERRKKLESEKDEELRNLPTTYGFDDMKALIARLRKLSELPPRGRPRKGKLPADQPDSEGPEGRKRAKRTTITDEIRLMVKKLVEEGKTGAAIAQEVGISVASVQNIKNPKKKGLSLPSAGTPSQ